MCYTVLQFSNNKEARELGKYTERLLTEWRQDAVSYLRPIKNYKPSIKIEMAHRYPEVEIRQECEEMGDYKFYGLAEQFFNLIQHKR